MSKDLGAGFLQGYSARVFARISCEDFGAGLPARIFNKGVVRGFRARANGKGYVPGFGAGFVMRVSTRVFDKG